jgi:hypothetical protein
MLIRFRTSNYRSIRDTAELTFPTDSDGQVSVIAALYGANASGKTNVLKALEFMRSAVLESHKSWKPGNRPPRTPFALDPTSASKPSLFEVDAIIDGVRHQYGFTLGPETVEEEWLYTYPEGRRRTLFERTGQEFDFRRTFKGPSRTVADLVRPNSLFVSAAAINNHEGVRDLYSWFESISFGGLGPTGGIPNTQRTEQLLLSENRREVERLMTEADLGISSVSVTTEDLGPEVAAAMRNLLMQIAPEIDLDDPDLPDVTTRSEIVFEHVTELGNTVRISFQDESRGSQVWFSHIGALLVALKHGGVLVVDELDASLHPRLSSEIIRMFANPETNPRRAQLIFSTHDTSLLGNLLEQHLSREDVWFTEKDSSGATILYPLTEFRPRKNEALERGYLQGRYGAVPILDFAELADRLA